MPAVEINLTTDQLVAAYTQLSQRERKAFWKGVMSQTTHPQVAHEAIRELQATLQRKFTPAQQKQLDRLMEANTERKLRPAEQKQLDQLMNEYGEDLVEKARARYLLDLTSKTSVR